MKWIPPDADLAFFASGLVLSAALNHYVLMLKKTVYTKQETELARAKEAEAMFLREIAKRSETVSQCR